MPISGLTEQDKLAITKASQTAGLTPQDVGTIQNLAITPTSLTPQTPLTPVTAPPANIPTPPVIEKPAEIPLTSQESQAETTKSSYDDLIATLTGQTSERAQKSFQQQQKEALGFNAAQSSVNEFYDQAQNLQHEAEGISLQLKQNLEQQQVNAQQGGANVTKGGLAPEQRAMQTRTNQQLLSNSIRQYSNAASLYAAQGKLSNALTMVNNAVNAEFEPKLQALEIAQRNLDNFVKSPIYKSADAKRVANTQAQIDAEKEKIITAKANATTIQGLVLQAQQNGAPAALTNQAKEAKDIYEVGQILSGWTAKETAQSIQEYNFAVKGGYKGSYSDYQNEDANRKALVAKAGVAPGVGEDAPLYSGLSSQTATAVRSQVSKFSSEPTVQNFATVQEGHNFAQTIANDTKNPAEHQAIIYALAKALDPGSVVREGEYATAQKYAQSWINAYGKGVEQAINGTGFLSSDAIRNIKATIAKKFEASNKSYTSLEKNYAQGINDMTGRTDGAKFVRSYRTTEETPTKSAFSDIQSNLTIDPTKKTASIPRSVWATLGDRMDALLAEAKADGYTLLVTD